METPYTPPKSATVAEAKPTATFSEILSKGFEAWKNTWKAWLLICLAALGFMLLSMLALFVGVIFAYGPLAIGMFACAFKALRGEEPRVGDLARGKERLGHGALVGFFLWGLQVLPMLLMYCIVFGLIAGAGAFNPGSGGGGGNQALGAGLGLGLMCGYLAFIAFFVCWTVFIKVRLLFVFPLMAEKDLGWKDAMAVSWEETKTGFWPLVGIQLLASIISGIGAYLCYVGLLATVPIYFTIIAAAYRSRFPAPTKDEAVWS